MDVHSTTTTINTCPSTARRPLHLAPPSSSIAKHPRFRALPFDAGGRRSDMSDTSQGAGWWQASDGKWYPPDTTPGDGSGAVAAPAAAPPAPGWVRPVYLYFLCMLGILIMAVGALGAVLGLVHLAKPDLRQGDPFTRI